MTKAELEIEYQKALDKIEEQKHLAEAVEAKDKEIAALREGLQLERARGVQNDSKAIENAVKHYEQENKQLREEINRRVRELNRIIALHGNLLKSLQGTLDNAIELNEYFVNEVNK